MINYDIKMNEEYPQGICSVCGSDFKASYIEPTRSQMVKRQLCFSCNFWEEKLALVDNPKSVRIEGVHYFIGDERGRGMRGFDGQAFRIRFKDGREVTTTNLWCQGGIPEHYKSKLPDNAEFGVDRR